MSSIVAPGLSCRNESAVPVLFVLSQISPLHWVKVDAGRTVHVPCGRVWFTTSVEPYVEGNEPTQTEVAARLTAVVLASLVFFAPGFAVTGLLSGVTSFKGVRKSGVYANGRVVVVKGRTTTGGVYELYIDRIEKTEFSEPLPVERPYMGFEDHIHV